MGSDPLSVCDRLFKAVMAGDFEAVREIYSPDAHIWHNFDGGVQTVEENLETLRWMTGSVAKLRYEEIRRQRTDQGFVQQHVLRGTTKDGKDFELPAVILCTVVDGHVTQLDEYFDVRHLAPLTGGATSLG